jgi:predicted cation transporter
MVSDLLVHAGLVVVLLVVLFAPFRIRAVEHNLEIFLFFSGIVALTIAGFATIEGQTTGWTFPIVEEALTAPLRIADVFGIPVGIVQIVLLVGLAIHFWHTPIHRAISAVASSVPLHGLVFILTVFLGLASSVISAIIAAIILVEIICVLPLNRQAQIQLTVIACFSIGLGAALTPLGEPLSTIAVTKLSGPPYHASFDFLLTLLGIYIVPGILAFGLLGAFVQRKMTPLTDHLECEAFRETLRDVFIRAAKIFVFIMALIFLGEGFKPIILAYVIHIPSQALFWVNSVSAVLDNATLTAAIMSPALTEIQIKSSLMALLISGGVLIPGNIPNIIAAGKLRITSREWARVGVPLGFITMVVYFIILFVPGYIFGL